MNDYEKIQVQCMYERRKLLQSWRLLKEAESLVLEHFSTCLELRLQLGKMEVLKN